MTDYSVYIDEAGDLGYRRGTRWFILTAVIVAKSDERTIRSNMASIRTKLNINEIHLRKIVDFNKRSYIVRELEREKFTYINIVVDTSKLNLAMSASSATAYNYTCRLLVERVSWFLRDTGHTADIVLSSRGTSRDTELIDYIKRLVAYGDNQVVSNVFGKIYASAALQRELLQLADICATTTFLAYEINHWGIRLPCHFKILRSHVYARNRQTQNYGLKYFSNDMQPADRDLRCNFACMKKERTPGATTT